MSIKRKPRITEKDRIKLRLQFFDDVMTHVRFQIERGAKIPHFNRIAYLLWKAVGIPEDI